MVFKPLCLEVQGFGGFPIAVMNMRDGSICFLKNQVFVLAQTKFLRFVCSWLVLW